MQLSEIRKAIINIATLVVAVGTPLLHETTGFLPENVAYTVSLVVAIAGAVVHYFTANETTDPVKAETQSMRLKAGRHALPE